jgi:excisionase family DNA binding protein
MPDDNSPAILTTGELARMARVERNTVTRWARDGRFPSIRTAGGHYRFHAAAAEAFLGRRSQPRPAPQRYAPEASARIRYGTRCAVALCKNPAAGDRAGGVITIILGVNTGGAPVALETGSLEWLDRLESAIQAARARFVVAGDLA